MKGWLRFSLRDAINRTIFGAGHCWNCNFPLWKYEIGIPPALCPWCGAPEVWRKGCGLYDDVNGVLYVYEKKAKP